MLDTVMLPQLPPLPLSAPVSQSGPATRFPSQPLAPSNLPSNLTLLLSSELTPELDQKLLLPTMVPLLLPLMLMLLVQLLLEELLPLDMVPDTVLVLLDMPHGNQEKQYSLFRHLH